MRHGGFGEAKQAGQIAYTELDFRERVEEADTRLVAENFERLGERSEITTRDEGAPDLGNPVLVGVKDVADFAVDAYRWRKTLCFHDICMYEQLLNNEDKPKALECQGPPERPGTGPPAHRAFEHTHA